MDIVLIVAGGAVVVIGILLGALFLFSGDTCNGVLFAVVSLAAGVAVAWSGCTTTAVVEASVVDKDPHARAVTIETDLGQTTLDDAESYLALANAKAGDKVLVTETTNVLSREGASYSDFALVELDGYPSFCPSCGAQVR